MNESLTKPKEEYDPIKRLYYVIQRDKERKLSYELYLMGFGIDYTLEIMDKIYQEITGKYYL